ncbi:Copper-transporting ATPase [Phytophthora rubi]|uniref:P-type Cu(+) transporter n=1 Tax=Phytophthora rubi TaxID=129364 RepID=A0A6A4FXK3_9STRA|nr:Copper-transporting ATPase [Phytophthora rubi]KAE9355678.1 Copper-transporting ATPase [Phytophthora rubi]
MGKRKSRRAAAPAALTEPVAPETSKSSCQGGGCCGAKSDGGEMAASCSSGEEDVASLKTEVEGETTGACVSSCCSDKEASLGAEGGCCVAEEEEAVVEVVVDNGCAFKAADAAACSSKAAADVNGADDCCPSKEVKQSGCCSSVEGTTAGGAAGTSGCCSSKVTKTAGESNECGASTGEPKSTGCCSSKKKEVDSECSSSKAPEAAIDADDCCTSKKRLNSYGCCPSKARKDEAGCSSADASKSKGKVCCSSKKETTESACGSSKASKTESGGCCSSPSGKRKASGSGCCSSKAKDQPLPERTPSFLNRLVQFRSDRGAALEKQRSNFSSLDKQRKTSESLETLRLNIGGMTCSGCCTRIEKFMIGQPGIADVNVSLLTSRGVFQFDPRLVTAKDIEQTVATLGFEPSVLSSDEFVSIVLHLGRPESAPRARKVLLEFAGVASAEVVDEPPISSASPCKAMLVEYNPDITGSRRIVRHLSRELGFTVQASSPRAPSVRAGEEEVRRFTRLLFWSCLFALPVVCIEFVLPAFFPTSDNNPADAAVWGTVNRLSIRDAVELLCATPALFLVARPIHESAYLALRYGGRVTMDVLISLSACTAYAFSVFTVVTEAFKPAGVLRGVVPASVDPLTGLTQQPPQEQVEAPVRADTFFQVTVLLITLILVGRSIETLVKARASNSVDALLRMQAKTAILLEDEDQKELYIDVVLVERGDLLKVLPGTRVPTDGVVVGGASSVDESMVTGEARKVPKEPGAIVIGGSINAQGVLTMRVTHTLHESMLARMVRLVGEAQASRGVRQSIADAVAAYFTTFIIILAVCMFVLWYSLAKHGHVDTQGWAPFPFALRFAITVLVISCPCAISLAVPTAVMVATTKGSQVGVLFKGGRALEALEEVDAVVFDKTGTLTTAQLGVAGMFKPSDRISGAQLWQYVASAESGSEHFIGKALVAHAETQVQDLQIDEAEGFEAVPGCGVHCTVREVDVRLGSLTWLKQQTYRDYCALRVPPEFIEANQRFQSQGCIVVFVVIDGDLQSAIALRDVPRPEAARVIEYLKLEGIQSWIVTGDQHGTAMSVAKALGVPEGSVLAESLPHQKVDKVRLLQSLGLRVAFVGDGVNDAPALATADVGVALGAGTDVALDAADVVLVKDDLRDLLNARALSRATNRRIKHNFAWGFMYNVLMMPVACGALYAPLGIWIPPALAGLSELLSSVPVILFSLLLNLWKPPFNGDWGLQQNHVAIDVSESTPLLHSSSTSKQH